MTLRLFAANRSAAGVARERRFDEAFRTLRSSLLVRLTDPSNVLMVAGARPREGKSTVAANLASALAVTAPVALVDADLRRPRQQDIFDLPVSPGLADVLGGSAPLGAALHRISGSLAVLTSGTRPSDPLALLDPSRLGDVLSLLRDEFRFIVVDSPPILAVADAMTIGPQTDGTLLILRWGEVTINDARLARQRLESSRSRLLGCVLTHGPSLAYADYQPYLSEYIKEPLGALESDPCY